MPRERSAFALVNSIDQDQSELTGAQLTFAAFISIYVQAAIAQPGTLFEHHGAPQIVLVLGEVVALVLLEPSEETSLIGRFELSPFSRFADPTSRTRESSDTDMVIPPS